jgi:O-methyltransferase involved in polyketide biosynthesis
MRGYTNIPFARKTAELISEPDKFVPDFNNNDFSFWARTLHFESRYFSIDQLLKDLQITNILELSSGYSFRGLEKTMHERYHYIDTDLPEVIATKKDIAARLKIEDTVGTLELLPLNALDEDQFQETVSHFPDGKIVVVNEGLLMYLNKQEKEKLCSNIYKVLKDHGGYWITSDVYIKHGTQNLNLSVDNKTKEFFEQHRIEENKFASFDEARAFFEDNGFVIDREENVDITTLGSMDYLRRSLKDHKIDTAGEVKKFQTTWRLRVAD